MNLAGKRLQALLLGCLCLSAQAQDEGRRRLDVPGLVPHDPLASKDGSGVKGITQPDEPEHPEPAATDFRDAKYALSFHVPAGWNFDRKDGVLSNFTADVRSSASTLEVRGVAELNYNPYPLSTFAGAMFYFSVLPKADAASCAAQAASAPMQSTGEMRIGGKRFQHGHDQHGHVCAETRNEVFTAMQGQSCLRFDLVVNTFCSQTSGAMTISAAQLGDIDARLQGILDSVELTGR